jgi:RNA polymerase sigma factor (sigma-70 family)
LSPAAHGEVLRSLYPRVLAKTLGLTRSLPEAEDAVHDAIERALKSWPESGTPDSPEAWLMTVAGNSFRDRLRRGRREELQEDALEVLAQMSPWVRIAVAEPEIARGWKDELLRLLFACCHPALDEGESAALALATVVGLSTSEIAAAFIAAPRSMEQRLTRARQRLRERGDYEGSAPDQSHDRVAAVLRAIHLLFNEGYWSTHDDAPIRAELCRLAIGLARSLLEAFPDCSRFCSSTTRDVVPASTGKASRFRCLSRIESAGIATRLPLQPSSSNGCSPPSRPGHFKSRLQSQPCTVARAPLKKPTGEKSPLSTHCSRDSGRHRPYA